MDKTTYIDNTYDKTKYWPQCVCLHCCLYYVLRCAKSRYISVWIENQFHAIYVLIAVLTRKGINKSPNNRQATNKSPSWQRLRAFIRHGTITWHVGIQFTLEAQLKCENGCFIYTHNCSSYCYFVWTKFTCFNLKGNCSKTNIHVQNKRAKLIPLMI